MPAVVRRALAVLLCLLFPSLSVVSASADTAPIVSISGATALEGNSGLTTMTFTVTLDRASSNAVQVAYRTQDGSATSPADYQAQVGSVTFSPGQTSRTVTVAAVGDTLDESDAESFYVYLTDAIGAVLVRNNYGVGRITDDDGDPQLERELPCRRGGFDDSALGCLHPHPWPAEPAQGHGVLRDRRRKCRFRRRLHHQAGHGHVRPWAAHCHRACAHPARSDLRGPRRVLLPDHEQLHGLQHPPQLLGRHDS